MTFPALIQTQNNSHFSAQWFDDCLSRYDLLLNTPLPPHHFKNFTDDLPINMDLLAWYSPWYLHTEKTYGIHLLDAGIVQFADQLHRACKDGNTLSLSREAAVLWSAYCLYCHELCHGWVEQFVGYCGDTRLYQNKSNFIKDEEALCNTAVYGLQHDLLENMDGFCSETSKTLQAAVNELKETFAKNKQDMLNALKAVMQNQSDGYKDYVPIEYSPLNHPVFLAKLSMLATHEYACNETGKVLPSIADPGVLVEVPAHYVQSPTWINPSRYFEKSSSQFDVEKPKAFEIIDINNNDKAYLCEKDLYIEFSQLVKVKNAIYKNEKNKNLFNKPEKIYIHNPRKIVSGVLSIFLMRNIKSTFLTNRSDVTLNDVFKIVDKHLNGDKDILECQEELISNGFKEFAKY